VQSAVHDLRGGTATPPPIPDDPTLWAAAPVTVGETDVTGVGVALSAGARLTGRVEFEGSAQPPPAERIAQLIVQIDAADGRTTSFNQFTWSGRR
jgi:hypothetical protein